MLYPILNEDKAGKSRKEKEQELERTKRIIYYILGSNAYLRCIGTIDKENRSVIVTRKLKSL